ncbi:MAG: hypothetical protein RL671_2346 [Pseudomonadota bacterium]
MIRRMMHLLAMLFVAAGWAQAAGAQTFAVASITNVDVGRLAAAAVGETVLRIDPATGSVTTVSGSGNRLTTQGARALVTISCAVGSNCNVSKSRITISTTGSPSGRALALRNFTVSTAGASATLDTQPGTGSNITFTLGPIGLNQSKTFWVGFDLPVLGDDAGGSSGAAVSPFLVTVARLTGTGANSLSQSATASVVRALSITKTADLDFGRLVAPSAGSGLVSLDQATGQVSVTGIDAGALPAPSPSVARFAVSGEGGQSITVSVPSSLTLTGPGGSIQVTTSANVSGAQTLSGSMGSAGALAVRVGGSYPISAATQKGTYSGSFTVMVQYN